MDVKEAVSLFVIGVAFLAIGSVISGFPPIVGYILIIGGVLMIIISIASLIR